MTATEDFLNQCPELEPYKDHFSCRYSKKGKILITSDLFNGERREIIAIPILRNYKAAEECAREIDGVLEKVNNDRDFFKDHPDFDQIEKVSVVHDGIGNLADDFCTRVEITLIPKAESYYLPAKIIASFKDNADAERIIREKTLKLTFKEYDPLKMEPFEEGFQQIIDAWRMEIRAAKDIPDNFPLLEADDRKVVKELFSSNMQLRLAKSIRQEPNGIQVNMGAICFFVNREGIMTWKRKDRLAAMLKNKNQLLKCYERIVEYEKEELIQSFKFDRDTMSFLVYYSYEGDNEQVTFSPDSVPKDKEMLLSVFQQERRNKIEKMKENIRKSRYLDDTATQCIMNVLKKNRGICSKSAIYNILNGNQEKSNYYVIEDNMMLPDEKLTLSQTEKILADLVRLGVLCTMSKYGRKLGGYYDVYSLTENIEILSFITKQEVRTDHVFEKYHPLDWKNFIVTECLEERSLEEWMELFQMWKEDVVAMTSPEVFVGFWKHAPMQILNYMKFSLNDQPLEIKRVWKDILEEAKK